MIIMIVGVTLAVAPDVIAPNKAGANRAGASPALTYRLRKREILRSP
jgi:hypothetical protein